MYRRIAPFAPTRDAIVQRFGRKYAYAALPYQDASYFDVPDGWVFTADDIERVIPKNITVNAKYGQQPQGSKDLNSTMRAFVRGAGRTLRGTHAEEFFKLFAAQVTVEDETAKYRMLTLIDPQNIGVSSDGTAK